MTDNTGKVRLLLPQYGRNVQKMVKFLKTIEDRELRNSQAQVVVGIMANLYPGKKDTDEFQHMLWDHLFMIAEFDLDIDSPYPKPDASMFIQTPQRLSYTQSQEGARNWGRYLPRMIKAISEKEGVSDEEMQAIAVNIANHAKKKSREFDVEGSMNESISEDIERFSGGRMHIEASDISSDKQQDGKQKKQASSNGKQGGRHQRQRNKKR